jgi:glucose-6-phosphate dehydrogenase assembly protein OpcA
MQPTPVISTSPGAIDRALRDLWANEATAVTRACLFNLVIYGTDARLTARAAQVAIDVAEQAPCRSIIVTAQPDSPTAPLQAGVSGSCKLGTGQGKQVCCEQIAIQADGDSRASLPALLASLLIPDVRVFFLPVGDVLISDELVPRLITQADRTVIDSSEFTDPVAGLAAAYRLFDGLEDLGHQVSDIHWMRCVPWREALAEIMEPPQYRKLLEDIDTVEVTFQFAPGEGPAAGATQALLYAGWLTSSLGWAAVEGMRREGDTIELRATAGPRIVDFRLVAAKETPAAPGNIAGVKLSADDHSAELQLAADAASVFAICDMGPECTTRYAHSLPKLDAANLVAGAIQLRSRQAAWRAALTALQPWLQ